MTTDTAIHRVTLAQSLVEDTAIRRVTLAQSLEPLLHFSNLGPSFHMQTP